MTESREHKESFVRWQGITIAQLGYVINLLLAFRYGIVRIRILVCQGKHISSELLCPR